MIRNLKAVFDGDNEGIGMRLIVMDRYYTSVALAIQLLMMGFYSIGTIMTNRLGYAKSVIEKKKTRPSQVLRGSCKIAFSSAVPQMCAVSWWDNKPVHFLGVGGNVSLDRVVRREKSGQLTEVPCPRLIKDYHDYMGGVDVHDQLRLQRYSIQRSVTFRKYYKSLFLGLVDMAIVNGFIVHKAFHARNGTKALSHVAYLKQLHIELCQLGEQDMYAGLVNRNAAVGDTEEGGDPGAAVEGEEHVCKLTDEWRKASGQLKRRQRGCKVCSMFRDQTSSGTSTFYCGQCRENKRVYLCRRAHRQIRGVLMTCWDIWHREFKNGQCPPSDLGNIRLR